VDAPIAASGAGEAGVEAGGAGVSAGVVVQVGPDGDVADAVAGDVRKEVAPGVPDPSFGPEVVDRPALRVIRERNYSPTEKILPILSGPFENQRILVAGGIGSGKSTELLVTAERLVGRRTVVLVDLWRHMESGVKDPGAIEHLQPWEIVALVGLAVLRATSEYFRLPCDEEARTFARALGGLQDRPPGEATLDVGRLATGLAVAVGGGMAGPAGGAAVAVGIEAIKAVGTAWSWKVGLRDAARRGDQDQAVEDLVQATTGVIQHLHDLLDRRVVVVVDGLDRVRVDGTFSRLFVESALLHRLPCDIVVSAHLALVHRHNALLRFRRYDLANEPVADPVNPWMPGKGVGFFRTLVDLRLQAIRQEGWPTTFDSVPWRSAASRPQRRCCASRPPRKKLARVRA